MRPVILHALLERVAYACRLPEGAPPLSLGEPDDTLHVVGDERFPSKKHTYFYDARAVLQYFPAGLRYRLVPGDVTWVPDFPSFVKSRPIAPPAENANSVLLKLNKVRHFVFVKDPLSWNDKDDIAVFRGKIYLKPRRMLLFERWFGKKGFDFGDTSGEQPVPAWCTPQLSIREQLRHRFILCIEGNDVSSNLKWVFHSNSIAVMPRPTCETWFEEGRLVPGVHYAECRPDFADLAEVVARHAADPALCRAINDAEHSWVKRFIDPLAERLVSLAVARRYFAATGQMPRIRQEV